MTEEIKNLVGNAKNVCLIPSQEPESLSAALALFYTLKDLQKNVNFLVDDFPEKLAFLVPSLDFISSPKNFVISVPRNVADVSQIYYEKTEENLKIHLTVNKGRVEKEKLSFYIEDAKPDVIITFGIQDFQKQLEGTLNSFGYLLGVPVINIDSSAENKKFGTVNVAAARSISETALELVKSLNESAVSQNVANCILSGLVIHYENFQHPGTTPEVLELAAQLMKLGAVHAAVVANVHTPGERENHFWGQIFQHLQATRDQKTYVASLDTDDFQKLSFSEAELAVQKIKKLDFQNNLLVLWKSHASDPMIKAFFYSKSPETLQKIALSGQPFHVESKDGYILLSAKGTDIQLLKESVLNSL